MYTPVGIYLRLRDKYRDTILLESTDFHAGENSYSFIGVNAIAGIEIVDKNFIEYKLPSVKEEKIALDKTKNVQTLLWEFMQKFEVMPTDQKHVNNAQGLFGYTSFDAVQFFETLQFKEVETTKPVHQLLAGQIGLDESIPLIRYRLYQYVIVINHLRMNYLFAKIKLMVLKVIAML